MTTKKKKDFMPVKWRLSRPVNTRWLKYALRNSIVTVDKDTGTIYDRRGVPHKVFTNSFGYKYVKVYMHSTSFSFYVHKCVYIQAFGSIPKNKELDHNDGDLTNNSWTNIIARTTKQNLKKIRRTNNSVPAF